MNIAKVVGQIWCSKRLPECPPGALLEVELMPSGGRYIAFDPIGCGEGERVMLLTGSAASMWFKDKPALIDALVLGVLDENSPGGEK